MSTASSAGSEKSPETLYEIGKLYSEKGDFKTAISKVEEAAKQAYSQQEFSFYLKCQNLLLRMYAEKQDQERINSVKESLQDLVIRNNVELNSKTYYALALCASFKEQNDTALEYLEKALALALAKDEKEDICYAINGLAIVYFALGRYDEALKEIYNLQVFFQVLPLPELKVSSLMMNGHILTRLGKYEEALDVFWQCYDQLKESKNLYMYINLLYAMGVCYGEAGDSNMSCMYLNLAKRTVDPENLNHLAERIEEKLQKYGADEEESYDIVFDPSSNSVVERKKGRVDFKNQFILMDMLRLFIKNPGEVYSKEALVRKVWKQDYDPSVHDNKIYVTIKRLRKMIEPDYDKPKYIFRAKNGYYLNRNTRVRLEH